ncbi:MAG: small nuclear ribonucleoprotein [Euryarchaeota archaeon]|nr:small nuclear ribonucleoprotein [Euryarchaeota archaeon]
MSKRPLDILHGALGSRVVVELKGGREYRGILDGYDHPHLNLVLKDAEEYEAKDLTRKCEQVVVRGDNIVFVLP